jgi:hypothetical protein
MERVATLIQKLQEQLEQHATATQLLVTVEMLQSELLHFKLMQPAKESIGSVAVQVAHAETIPATEEDEDKVQVTERTVEVLNVDEAEMEAELEEIKKNAQSKNNMGSHIKPAMLFDPVEDTPTLFHQDPEPTSTPVGDESAASKNEKAGEKSGLTELHERIGKDDQSSLNDRLKQAQIELGDSLVDVPIKDLKKAIGVNDRFLFINDLFRGDEVMYERSIKTINGFAIYPEAEYWIKRELKLKLGWNERDPVVKQFDQLIKRRFL